MMINFKWQYTYANIANIILNFSAFFYYDFLSNFVCVLWFGTIRIPKGLNVSPFFLNINLMNIFRLWNKEKSEIMQKKHTKSRSFFISN